MTFDIRHLVALLGVVAVLACGDKQQPPPTQPAPAPAPAAPAPATAPATAAPAKPAPATPATAAKPPEPPEPKPDAAAKPAEPPKPVEAAPAPALAPAASAHAKVGPQKCKMCHRVEFDSWSASPHAAKGLDCEGCHGNGADYWSASVMRDRQKAIAAGLVMPEVGTCKRCHGAKADASLLPKAHAHKGG
jgi:hypothetical protein